MTLESNVVGQITPTPPESTGELPLSDVSAPVAAKAKLSKALPSERVSFEKSTVLLRCFAIGAGSENKPVSNALLADLSKLNESTAGVNNVFFAQAGLINKVGNGYTPCAEVVSFERAFQFNPETAGQKLAPALRRSWFGAALLPKLAVRAITEDEALGELAEACRAQPEHKPQLRALLDYLVLGAVIDKDGTSIKQGRLAREDGPTTKPEEPAMTPQAQTPVQPNGVATPRVQTSFSGAAGGLDLQVNIQVDMVQMGTWPPQVVSAFMAGLAQVITAKAAAEASTAR